MSVIQVHINNTFVQFYCYSTGIATLSQPCISIQPRFEVHTRQVRHNSLQRTDTLRYI